MNARLVKAIAVGAALAALAGCSQDMSDLEQYAQEIKSRKTTAIEPIPQIKQYEAFAYEPGDRRDPFLPAQRAREETLATAASSAIQQELIRNKEPLEEFPLDSLRMVGTITVKSQAYALIKAPDAVVHRVTIGDHMGQNYGKIVKVSESEVELLEIIPDGFGGWMQRPASVALAE